MSKIDDRDASKQAQVNKDNFRDFIPGDVENAVGSVKFGFDPVAARNLIHYFHYMLQNDLLFSRVTLSPVERAFVEYVSLAFARIAEDGKSTDVAFGLKPGRGKHPREDTDDRDFLIAAYIVRQTRDGVTTTKAATINAAILLSIGHTTANDAYSKYRDAVALMPNEQLDSLLSQVFPTTPTTKHD